MVANTGSLSRRTCRQPGIRFSSGMRSAFRTDSFYRLCPVYEDRRPEHCHAACCGNKKIKKYPHDFYSDRLSPRPVAGLRNHSLHRILRDEAHYPSIFYGIRIFSVLFCLLPYGNLFRYSQHSRRDLHDHGKIKRSFPRAGRRRCSLRNLFRRPLFSHVIQRQPGGFPDGNKAV